MKTSQSMVSLLHVYKHQHQANVSILFLYYCTHTFPSLCTFNPPICIGSTGEPGVWFESEVGEKGNKSVGKGDENAAKIEGGREEWEQR